MILYDLHMIINNLRWYNQKSKVLIFPSYFNNCQSSCFYHHISWQFATFSSNTITVLVNKLSKTPKKYVVIFRVIINYPILKEFIQVSMQIKYLAIQGRIFSSRNVHMTNKSMHIYFPTYFNLSQLILLLITKITNVIYHSTYVLNLFSNWVLLIIQGKSQRFDSCHRPSNFTQIGFKLLIFLPIRPWNLRDDIKNNGHFFLLHQPLCTIPKTLGIQTGVTVQKRQIGIKIGEFFVLYDLGIWWMTLTCDGAPFICYLNALYIIL